jgi:predicted nicotinamide N-methyase
LEDLTRKSLNFESFEMRESKGERDTMESLRFPKFCRPQGRSIAVISKFNIQNSALPLQTALAECLPGVDLALTTLPGPTGIRLWLLDGATADRPLPPEVARRLADGPPFWSVCWAAGLVLADYFHVHAELVRGKTVLDFGAGSGVVAIAAARAGAARACVVDCDPIALEACRVNATVNGVSLEYFTSLEEAPPQADWVTAADLFYDHANLELLAKLRGMAGEFLVGDARCQALAEHGMRKVETVGAQTVPTFHDPQFETVTLWRGR